MESLPSFADLPEGALLLRPRQLRPAGEDCKGNTTAIIDWSGDAFDETE